MKRHLTATECHVLYGITSSNTHTHTHIHTQCYLPPDTSEHTPRLSDANKLTYLLTYLLT